MTVTCMIRQHHLDANGAILQTAGKKYRGGGTKNLPGSEAQRPLPALHPAPAAASLSPVCWRTAFCPVPRAPVGAPPFCAGTRRASSEGDMRLGSLHSGMRQSLACACVPRASRLAPEFRVRGASGERPRRGTLTDTVPPLAYTRNATPISSEPDVTRSCATGLGIVKQFSQQILPRNLVSQKNGSVSRERGLQPTCVDRFAI